MENNQYTIIYNFDRSRAAYHQNTEVKADIEIYNRNGCWYAKALLSFTPPPLCSTEPRTLEIILNSPGKSKAIEKIRREIATKYLREPEPRRK